VALILDENIVISAYMSSGPARRFWRRATENHYVLLSTELFQEVEVKVRTPEFNCAQV